MGETPSPSSLQRKRHQYTEEEDGEDDSIKCSGEGCESCMAGLVVDCVAICCCPCAFANILAFTFLKIPYIMGRKLLKGKMKMRKNKRKCERRSHSSEIVVVMEGGDGNSRIKRVAHEGVIMLKNDLVLEFEVEEFMKGNFRGRFEDKLEEDVWLESYKIGHLGFGSVSFTDSPSEGKQND